MLSALQALRPSQCGASAMPHTCVGVCRCAGLGRHPGHPLDYCRPGVHVSGCDKRQAFSAQDSGMTVVLVQQQLLSDGATGSSDHRVPQLAAVPGQNGIGICWGHDGTSRTAGSTQLAVHSCVRRTVAATMPEDGVIVTAGLLIRLSVVVVSAAQHADRHLCVVPAGCTGCSAWGGMFPHSLCPARIISW